MRPVQPDEFLRLIREWAKQQYPEFRALRVSIELDDAGRLEKVKMPIPPAGVAVAERDPFVPGPVQKAILEALEGEALRSDALGTAVGGRSRIFQHPGGLKELQQEGLVKHHNRLGFYRPDAPPPTLEENLET